MSSVLSNDPTYRHRSVRYELRNDTITYKPSAFGEIAVGWLGTCATESKASIVEPPAALPELCMPRGINLGHCEREIGWKNSAEGDAPSPGHSLARGCTLRSKIDHNLLSPVRPVALRELEQRSQYF